jgi:hypothetical protein
MLPYVDRIVSNLQDVEKALARDVYEQRRRWRYHVRRGRVWFDREARDAHRYLKQRIPSFLRHGSLRNLLTTPIIYSLAVPLLLLDLWITLYQWVCFPVYDIDRVQRRRYFVIDRHKLAYLNGIEKANCVYCGYANGLLAYVREVAARTEQYWCPIKHSRPIRAPHGHYQLFFDYGDAAGYRQGLAPIRAALKGRRSPTTRAERVRR